MRVSIIGTGYVGLTTGACLAYLGHDVTCLDVDETKVAKLMEGKAPIYEPHLEDLLCNLRDRIQFTTRYEDAVPGAQVIFIAVGTPPQPDGNPDLRYLRAAAECTGRNLGRGFTVVVNKSTVPIGSGNWVGALLREAVASMGGGSPEASFAVASNPEFLREGTAIYDTLYPDRVVIGSDEPHALEVLYTLYRPVLEQTFASPSSVPRPEELGAVPLISTDLASAELIKYAANSFLALKISYINEIGQLAEKVGADIMQVAKGIGLDARIGTRFLQAGLGWGGSCFGKDTAALISTAGEYGLQMQIVSAAREVNYQQRERVVEKLLGELKILKGRTVGLLGLAFKPQTDDLREAPALTVIRKLADRGCRVKAHDPVAMERFRREYTEMPVLLCARPEEALADCDAGVLVTDWPEYRDLAWEVIGGAMRKRILLDGRNFLDGKRLAAGGFQYLSFGA
jgi:UDPglucose 6-dehydrogenase